MGFNVTLPVNMTLRDWADTVTYDLQPYILPQVLLDETKWQDWAVVLVATTTLSGNNPPNPYQFDNWQDWAMRFCNAVMA